MESSIPFSNPIEWNEELATADMLDALADIAYHQRQAMSEEMKPEEDY
jgi:hypothetical protein